MDLQKQVTISPTGKGVRPLAIILIYQSNCRPLKRSSCGQMTREFPSILWTRAIDLPKRKSKKLLIRKPTRQCY